MTREWFDQVRQSGLGHTETFEATYDLARAVLSRGVPGDMVECGVYAGAQCAIMARAVMDHMGVSNGYNMGDMPRVHLFDSFTGIPAPGPYDHELRENKGGESACSLEDVKSNMKRWGIPDELLVYHPGRLETTCEDATNSWDIQHKIHAIALLRMDADLYESTKPIMQYLYPLVSRGGWVIVDDWNLSGCRQAVQETVVPAPIYWRVPTK